MSALFLSRLIVSGKRLEFAYKCRSEQVSRAFGGHVGRWSAPSV